MLKQLTNWCVKTTFNGSEQKHIEDFIFEENFSEEETKNQEIIEEKNKKKITKIHLKNLEQVLAQGPEFCCLSKTISVRSRKRCTHIKS